MPDEPIHGLSPQELAESRVCLRCRVIAVPGGAGWEHPPALAAKFAFTGVCDAPQPGAVPKEREIRFGRGKAPGDKHSISGTVQVDYRPGDPVTVGTDGAYVVKVVNGKPRKLIGWGYVATTGAYGAGSSAPSTRIVGRERVLVGELRAVYWALKACPREVPVTVLIDSAYARRWLERWRAGETEMPHGYSLERPEGRRPRLVELAEVMRDGSRQIKVSWVPAHSGVPLNEGADRMASLCRSWSIGRISKQVLRRDAEVTAHTALTRHFEAGRDKVAG